MKRIMMVLLAGLALAGAAHADDDNAPPYHDKLLGDLGGERTKLADAGVDVSLNYEGDVWQVLSGGKKRIATYLDYVQLSTTIDNEKLFGLKGNTMTIALIDDNGTRTNGSTVGSIQGIDNSEVVSNGVRLYEAWMQQEFFDGRVSLLAGVHDLNTEFASTTISDNYLMPTMQIGQSFADSGRNGPSIFPQTSLAARLKVKPTESSYVMAAIFDGVPGDPPHNGSAIRLDDKDGSLLVAEMGLAPKVADTDDAVNKLAVGVWEYTGAEANLEYPSIQSTPQGMYLLSSYRFYHDKDAGKDVTAFARGGFADGQTEQTDWDYEAGVVAHGFVPKRPDGEIGIGISEAHNSRQYMSAQETAGTPAEHAETSFELYYRDAVAQGITVQPDVQYIVNPGTDPTLDNALVIGARFGVSF